MVADKIELTWGQLQDAGLTFGLAIIVFIMLVMATRSTWDWIKARLKQWAGPAPYVDDNEQDDADFYDAQDELQEQDDEDRPPLSINRPVASARRVTRATVPTRR
jgi:hypothetical protein